MHDSPEVYADAEALAAADLVLQCYTQGVATDEQVLGLSAAVRAGTGLAGWHGGIVDSFRGSPDYLHLTGGQWAAHPGGFVEYDAVVVAGAGGPPDRRRARPLVAPHRAVLGAHRRRSTTCWRRRRSRSTADTPWREELTCPAVWTRQWGAGRVFVSTIGHKLEDLDVPDVRTLTERGLLWASR